MEITYAIRSVTQVGGPYTDGPYPRQAFEIRFWVTPIRILLNDTTRFNLPSLPGLCRTYTEASDKAEEWLRSARETTP